MSHSRRKSKYEPLKNYLLKRSHSVTISFTDLEKILGFRLPNSAFAYAAWWANDDFHSHSRAWLDAGMYVKNVKLGDAVTFTKKLKRNNLEREFSKINTAVGEIYFTIIYESF